MENVSPTLSGWVKLYHPRGPLVTLPVPVDPAAALAHVGLALDSGWLVTAPGLEPGEEKDVIGWICRRSKTNQDGSESHVLDLFIDNEQLKHRKMSIYLDSEDDVADMLYATGLKTIEQLPLFPATAPAERGKSSQTDKYIVRLPGPTGFVFAPNPKYNADAAAAAKARGEVYGVPKFKFVRWERVRPSSTTTEAPAPGAPGAPAGMPSQDAVNAELARVGGSWAWALQCIDKQYGTKHGPGKAGWENIPTAQLQWFTNYVKTLQPRPASPPPSSGTTSAASLAHKLTPEAAALEFNRQMDLVGEACEKEDFARLRASYARLVPSFTDRQARDLIEYIDAAERSVLGGARGR